MSRNKIPLKSNFKQHPWGNDPLWSDAHRDWLANKLIGKVRRQIKTNQLRIRFEQNFHDAFFFKVWKKVEQEIVASGWQVNVMEVRECGAVVELS